MNMDKKNTNQTGDNSMGLNPQHVNSSGSSPEVAGQKSVPGGGETQGEIASEKNIIKGEQSPEVSRRPATEENIKAPVKNSENKQKFENPYKLYGYNPSDNLIQEAAQKGNTNLIGDVNSSRNWLLVLLSRLIRNKN